MDVVDKRASGPCNFSFQLVPLITLPQGEEIGAVVHNGRDLFVGTTRGMLYKYPISLENKKVDASQSKLMEDKSKYGITQLHIVGGLNYLMVLCGGSVTIHSLKDLFLIKTVPSKHVAHFCCSDGSPFYGLCISTKNKLVLYDLQQEFSVCKTLVVPEQPKMMKWMKKYICIGFRSEYSLMLNNGGPPRALMAVSHTPIIEILPMDELALAHKKTVLFAYANRRKSRETVNLQHVPQKIVFSFPFLVAVSADGMEIHNLMNSIYLEVLKKPCDIKAVISDGRDIIVAGASQIYHLTPKTTSYFTKDPDMLNQVLNSPTNKGLFVKYIYDVLRDPQNPFKLLLSEHEDKFLKKFQNSEPTDLKLVKLHISISLKKIFKVFVTYFKQFRSQVWQELMFSTLQTIYYAKIYNRVYAMINTLNEENDKLAREQVKKYEKITPGLLGAQKQFWLTPESMEDPPKKKKPTELGLKMSNSRKGSSYDLPTQVPQETNKQEPVPTAGPYEPGTEEEIRDMLGPLPPPSSFTVPPVESRSRTSAENRTRKNQKLRQTVSLSLQALFMGEGRMNINTEAELYEISKKESTLIGKCQLTVDESDLLYVQLASTPHPIYIMLEKDFSFYPEDSSVTWHQSEHHYKLVFSQKQIFTEVTKQLQVYQTRLLTNSQMAMDSVLLETVVVADVLGEDVLYDDQKSPRKSPRAASPLPAERPEPDTKKIETGDKRIPNRGSGTPSRRSRMRNAESKKEEEAPYQRATETLKKITQQKSPRDKLGCILQTFTDIIQCISDYWDRFDREPVVGADDLVPLFTYVVLKAKIPTLYSEMNFVWEFASDAEMNGKYGYGFATFQIGVEAVAHLDDSIWGIDVKEKTSDDKKLDNLSASSQGERIDGILQKRDQLVKRRGSRPVSQDYDDLDE